MDGTELGLSKRLLVPETRVLHLGTDQRATHLDVLAANNNNLLAVKDLLGNNTGQAAKQVATAVNRLIASNQVPLGAGNV